MTARAQAAVAQLVPARGSWPTKRVTTGARAGAPGQAGSSPAPALAAAPSVSARLEIGLIGGRSR
ncbi:MAG: hypothetical protein H6713_25055 [Myxococcales bacterium]|nr:hypothetical protein [Myxococcales bacterium]